MKTYYLLLVVISLGACSPTADIAKDVSPSDFRSAIEKEVSEQGGASDYIEKANNGNIEFQNNVGLMYQYGILVNKDTEIAAQWYEKAASNGHNMASYNLGGMYYEGAEKIQKDYKMAFHWLSQSAEAGFERAQNLLGQMYRKGEGVDTDLEKSFYWYKKAAIKQYPVAEYNLGLMYLNGMGVSQNEDEAIKWIKRSADHGYKSAIEFIQEMEKQKTTNNGLNTDSVPAGHLAS